MSDPEMTNFSSGLDLVAAIDALLKVVDRCKLSDAEVLSMVKYALYEHRTNETQPDQGVKQ
jgi:soluble cytochrome b562